MQQLIYAKSLEILETLIAFDTTSRGSNLAMIEWIERYLAQYAISAHRIPNADATKANLYATAGPAISGGVILSGHSDVVPVDGQDWASDPWQLTQRRDLLHGRGTCDMKGFIALALAAVPIFAKGARPVHLAISYDEEIGCLGAPAMIAQIADKLPAPRLAIVGEPTLMKIVNGHKGIAVHEVEVFGHEAHSSLPHIGLSANMVAIELMHMLADISRELYARGDARNGFDPPHATLTIGMMEGGTAANILARHCRFVFDLRCPPGEDASDILADFKAHITALDSDMKAAFPDTGAVIRELANAPPLHPQADSDAEKFVRSIAGDNAPAGQVSYAAEAGQFQQAGFPTIICGPGSIEQAHQPNEYVAVDQMQRGAQFMVRLAEAMS